MKKTVRLIAMLVMIAALVSAVPNSASALTTAKSIVAPSANVVKIQNVEATHNSLAKKAYDVDQNMVVIELCEMPDEAEIKYVQSEYGYCIHACTSADKDSAMENRDIKDGTRVTVYYRTSGYAFVETEDGLVCWCRSDLLKDSFDAKLQAARRAETKEREAEANGRIGLLG